MLTVGHDKLTTMISYDSRKKQQKLEKESLLQFFSVALVHFSDQKLHFQNYLFNLHII